MFPGESTSNRPHIIHSPTTKKEGCNNFSEGRRCENKVSSISNKTIGEYLESQGIRHSNIGFKYLMLGIRVSLDGKVNYARINSVYEEIGRQAGVTVGQVDCAIRSVIRKTENPVSNKEFLIRAVDTLTWSHDADASIPLPSQSG